MHETHHIAYLAGLLDGEGHVGLMKKVPYGAYRSTRYNLRVAIGMYSDETITWVHERFGGARYEKKPYVTKNGVRRFVCHEISWQGQKAAGLLRLLLPFLITKRQHAEYGIKFQEGILPQGGVRVSEDEIARRERIYQDIRTLNARCGTSLLIGIGLRP